MERAGEGENIMLQEFPTIYRAKNLQEAQLLCNILEHEGIRTTLTNSVLENGSGVDIVGWPTLPRVMVAEEDAVRAREIALKFDREVSGRGGTISPHRIGHPLETKVLDVWPCCPQCGKRRLTRCAFCGTSGSDFPPADANAGDLFGLPTPPAEAFSGCSCGPGGCGAHPVEEETNLTAADDDSLASPPEPTLEPPSSTLLLCPTCDEPFHPQYLRRCEWCGHEFSDGVENPIPEARVQEPFNWRITYVIYILVLLGIAFLAYLLVIFRDSFN
jgi:hypothetical protein